MNKLSKVLVLNILLLLAVGGFSGCNSTEGNTTANTTKATDNKNSTTVSETNKKPEDVKPASDNTKSDEVASTGDKIGVPECDEYIAKYEACVNNNVPENMKAAMKSTFEQSRKGWKDAAATPQGKATLGSACKQAMETAKQSMAAYKCDF
jgi:hypothetical protein